jgi:sulfatase maturation enzyme AslB (radical SAM superfamily)
MTHEKLAYLLEHNVGFCTSLDGDEKTHNFNRVYRSGNSYDLVTYWIREINRFSKENFYRETIISPLLTVTKATLKNWKNCVDTYLEYGSPQIFWRPLNALGF